MEQQNTGRLLSVDVLRGWTIAAMLLVNNAGDWDHVFTWLEHAEWNGCMPADFIFPFFLVIVGLSLALALTPQIERGVSIASLRRDLLWRALRLFCLGLVLHWIASVTIDGRAFRLLGVLQRIGICFALAGLALLYLRSAAQRWCLLTTVLLSYSVLLLSSPSLALHQNMADQLDTRLLGHLAYRYDAASGLAHDPEGILSTLGAFSSVLLGVQAAAYLRRGTIRSLLLLGAALMVGGALLTVWLPFNKSLWTASFALWTGGAAYLLIAVLYVLVDQKHWKALGRSFGINAIAAYAGSWGATCLLAVSGLDVLIYQSVFTPLLVPVFSENFASLAFALSFTGVFALVMLLMARKNWRIVI